MADLNRGKAARDGRASVLESICLGGSSFEGFEPDGRDVRQSDSLFPDLDTSK